METRIGVAMVLGYSSAIFCGYLGARSVITRIHSRPSKATPKLNLVWPLGITGAAIGAVAGFFLAGIIGGTVGLLVGQSVSSLLGIGIAGAPIGLALGIFLVFTAITCAGALCGAILGRLLNHAVKLVSIAALALGAAVVVPMVYFGLTPLAIDGVVVTPRPSCDNKTGRETHSSSRWENGTLVVNISEAQTCGLSQQSVAVQRIGSSLFVRTKYDGVPAACICRQNFSLAVPGVPEQSYEIAVYNLP